MDHRNRLTEVTERATHGGAATQVVAYAYDTQNRLVGRFLTATGDGPNGWANTYYTYDGPNIVLERGPARATPTTASSGGPRSISFWPPTWPPRAPTRRALAAGRSPGHDPRPGPLQRLQHHDLRTRPLRRLRQHHRRQPSRLRPPLHSHRPPLRPRHRLAVQPQPMVRSRGSRWLSHDPISLEGGDVNLYRYVANSPPNGVDPDGLDWRTVSEGLKGVAQGGANILNGLQDTAIGAVNLAPMTVNGIAWLERRRTSSMRTILCASGTFLARTGAEVSQRRSTASQVLCPTRTVGASSAVRQALNCSPGYGRERPSKRGK